MSAETKTQARVSDPEAGSQPKTGERVWEKLPEAATIPEGGTAARYRTGGWRTERPVWDEEKCSQCMICFMFCPDSSIEVSDSKMTGIDLEHCKGCAICARECPRDAIDMVPEDEIEE